MDIKQDDLIRFRDLCGLPIYDSRNPKPTLQTIFMRAIPKLQERGYTVSLVAKQNGGFDIWIGDVTKKSIGELVESKNPTEALYNAIMKVVNKDESY